MPRYTYQSNIYLMREIRKKKSLREDTKISSEALENRKSQLTLELRLNCIDCKRFITWNIRRTNQLKCYHTCVGKKRMNGKNLKTTNPLSVNSKSYIVIIIMSVQGNDAVVFCRKTKMRESVCSRVVN